jgi:hypothetical protein
MGRVPLTQTYHGPIEDATWFLLQEVHSKGLSVQSNLARYTATHVALLASLGWVTTINPNGTEYGSRWLITAAGLIALQNKELLSP